jgi:Aspartyl/asparaginyl-tRNA synthetases
MAVREYGVDIFFAARESAASDQSETDQMTFVIQKVLSEKQGAIVKLATFTEELLQGVISHLIKYYYQELLELKVDISYFDLLAESSFINIHEEQISVLLERSTSDDLSLSSEDLKEVSSYFCDMPVFIVRKNSVELILPNVGSAFSMDLLEHENLIPFSQSLTHATGYLSYNKLVSFVASKL